MVLSRENLTVFTIHVHGILTGVAAVPTVVANKRKGTLEISSTLDILVRDLLGMCPLVLCQAGAVLEICATPITLLGLSPV
jgi:hypothetical protein